MDIIIQKIAYLYVFILVGYFFGKGKKGINSHTPMLSFLAINLFLSAKVFRSFATYFTVGYIKDHYKLLLISLALLAVLHLAGKLIAWLMRSGEDKGPYEYTVTISNYGYIGYSLVEGIFGAMAQTDMILFCLPFSLYTYTVGYIKLTGGKFSFKRLLNPVTMASVLGMIVGISGLQMPNFVSDVLSACSGCVGPITMLLTGFTLSEFSLVRLLGDGKVYIMTAVRLVILPMLVFTAFKLLKLEAFMMAPLVMAAMPSGLNPIIFAKNMDRSPELGAKLALITHAFSCVTLPIWLSVLS